MSTFITVSYERNFFSFPFLLVAMTSENAHKLNLFFARLSFVVVLFHRTYIANDAHTLFSLCFSLLFIYRKHFSCTHSNKYVYFMRFNFCAFYHFSVYKLTFFYDKLSDDTGEKHTTHIFFPQMISDTLSYYLCSYFLI